ncbi:MAG: hypothetical protein E2599_16750, partial [Klebsiella sp.]|nr:hypothetical protein [Klebsiella sp.]
MATVLKKTDVAIVGFGWVGAIMAKELTEAGLNVVALERGPIASRLAKTVSPPAPTTSACVVSTPAAACSSTVR